MRIWILVSTTQHITQCSTQCTTCLLHNVQSVCRMATPDPSYLQCVPQCSDPLPPPFRFGRYLSNGPPIIQAVDWVIPGLRQVSCPRSLCHCGSKILTGVAIGWTIMQYQPCLKKVDFVIIIYQQFLERVTHFLHRQDTIFMFMPDIENIGVLKSGLVTQSQGWVLL